MVDVQVELKLLFDNNAKSLTWSTTGSAEGDINEFATIKSFNYITLDHWFESGRPTIFLPRDAMHARRQLCRHAVSVCLCVCPSVFLLKLYAIYTFFT